MEEKVVSVEGVSLIEFFGANNTNLTQVKRAFPQLKIVSRGAKVKAIGSEKDLETLENKLQLMMEFLRKYGSLTEQNVRSMLSGLAPADIEIPKENNNKHVILHGQQGRVIQARTPNQRKMVEMMNHHDLLFAIGPAGTGKTYTAVALAVKALKNKQVKKIILTRPAVEAGERLGFLPGDLKEKIDPYLRPLYDALDDMLPYEKLEQHMQNRVIEIAPLAFMRGRTLDNAFLILDEAQNATDAQLKMFLTRLGPSAKCIVTGDLTQIDLPPYQRSGMITAIDILQNIDEIAMVFLNESDVIRHRLVKAIIKAYGRHAMPKSKKEKEEKVQNGQEQVDS